MPYFFILPIYAVFLFVMAVVGVVARCVPRFRQASGYIVGGTIGTLLGFIVANVIVTVAGILPVWLAQKITLPQWLEHGGKYLVLAILLIGPFVASVVGVALGFATGTLFVFRRRRKRAV